VNVFQRTKFSVMKHIHDDYVLYSIVVHCMAHHTNLVVHTLSMFHLVNHIENLLQTLHAYFAYFFKRHLEFTKLAQMI